MDARTRENGVQVWLMDKELRRIPMALVVTMDSGSKISQF
jgi:hypothetical protein